MKIQDLSIGDWVAYNNDNYQILNLGALAYVAGVGLQYRSYLALTKGYDIHDDVDIGDISPVPLTLEILEKNGWELDKYRIWHRLSVDDNTHANVFLGVERCRIEVMRKSGDSDYFSCYADVEPEPYVHNLQRVLRLVGVDKEIVL